MCLNAQKNKFYAHLSYETSINALTATVLDATITLLLRNRTSEKTVKINNFMERRHGLIRVVALSFFFFCF